MSSRSESASPYDAWPPKPRKPEELAGNPVNLDEISATDDDEDYLAGNQLRSKQPARKRSVKKIDRRPEPIDTSIPFRPNSLLTSKHRIVIALDFGTTYTGVAYAAPNNTFADLDIIQVIQDWGNRQGDNLNKIPSVISYTRDNRSGAEQWGTDLSEDAVAMINVKLELDTQANRVEELSLLLQAIEGMQNLDFDYIRDADGEPDYTWKSPELIVADYMEKIIARLNQVLDERLTREVKLRLPLDVVLTVPVQWSYRARNATIRAVRKAGLNSRNFENLQNVIVVTEPEAAAIYTARFCSTDQSAYDCLQDGEYFVLCDAGGGTVDTVAYRVTKSVKSKGKAASGIDLERITLPTSAKCGATYIDVAFKRWLRDEVLGPHNFAYLDPKNAGRKINARYAESGALRNIMKKFDLLKKSFSRSSRDFKLDLPAPLDNLDVDGFVEQGELTIPAATMRKFFDPCINRIIALIKGHNTQIEMKDGRLNTIFLAGGFGESPYLQERLEKSFGELRGIRIRRTEQSWTAVVRGAVIHGIERDTLKGSKAVKLCGANYGIVLDEMYHPAKYQRRDVFTDRLRNVQMARKQFTWMIKDGDLIQEDETRETEKECMVCFQERDSKVYTIPVYEYKGEKVPDRVYDKETALRQISTLRFDLSTIPITQFDRYWNEVDRNPYYAAQLVCKMTMVGRTLTVGMYWEGQQLCLITQRDIPLTK